MPPFDNKSKPSIEVRAIGPGDCIFDAINEALRFFGRPSLDPTLRSQFRYDNHNRVVIARSKVNDEQNYGGSLVVSLNAITERLRNAGIETCRMLVATTCLEHIIEEGYLSEAVIPLLQIR